MGNSHAYGLGTLAIEDTYPYLLSQKINYGYDDCSFPGTGLSYSYEALKQTYDETLYDFVLFQLGEPWRWHQWEDIFDPRRWTTDKSLKTLMFDHFKVINEYKDKKVIFFYVCSTGFSSPYYFKKMCKLSSNVYPEVLELIDIGIDELTFLPDKWHGGINTHTRIADKLYQFLLTKGFIYEKGKVDVS